MERFKFIVTLVTSLFIGFGLWFMVFWFLTMEPNLFIWEPWVKITYLILSFVATSGVSETLFKDRL